MSTENDYLLKVLRSQTLEEGSRELTSLREQRAAVDKILRSKYGQSARIQYGGSHAKGTMIKANYDLDVICFFARDYQGAGSSLEDIYHNVADVLEATYRLQRKTSAIRLVGLKTDWVDNDFHVDVVPGRYIDGCDGPVFLHQEGGPKERLKTDPMVHIDYIKDSGFQNALRLVKLWGYLNGVHIRQFVLDLAVIDILANRTDAPLNEQIRHVWTLLADSSSQIAVKDPANPEGNDLYPAWLAQRAYLAQVAQTTLDRLERDGMEVVFEIVNRDQTARARPLAAAVASSSSRTKPWSNDD